MNKCIYNIIIITQLFFLLSCNGFNNLEKDDFNELTLEENINIESGQFKSFVELNNHWDNINHKSYIFNYEYKELSKVKFGKGVSDTNLFISNPILKNNYIYLVDNHAMLTKYNINSNSIEWSKIIDENIQKNVAAPASLISTNNSIIVTTGEGSINSFDFEGNLIWNKKFKMSIKTASYLLNDLILIFLNDGHLIALDIYDGSQRWIFNKEYKKISSHYGGKFYNHKNNLFALSPKNNIYFIDNFLYEYSNLDQDFMNQFIPLNDDNYDYKIDLYTYKNLLIIIENNDTYTLYDTFENDFKIRRNKFPLAKYISVINDSIFAIDKNNYLRTINITNGKLFWKVNIDKYLKDKYKVINIIETIDFFYVFIDNGNILFLDKLSGSIEEINKLKINNIRSLYFLKDYILFINEKARLHIYK